MKKLKVLFEEFENSKNLTNNNKNLKLFVGGRAVSMKRGMVTLSIMPDGSTIEDYIDL